MGTIPISAFLMGVVAVAAQFYVRRKEDHSKIRKTFTLTLVTILLSLGAFVVVNVLSVTSVSIQSGKSSVGIITGFENRLDTDSCPCDQHQSDADCIDILTIDPGSSERCWNKNSINAAKIFLIALYLLMTGSFGALIGLLMRQEAQLSRDENSEDGLDPV